MKNRGYLEIPETHDIRKTGNSEKSGLPRSSRKDSGKRHNSKIRGYPDIPENHDTHKKMDIRKTRPHIRNRIQVHIQSHFEPRIQNHIEPKESKQKGE